MTPFRPSRLHNDHTPFVVDLLDSTLLVVALKEAGRARFGSMVRNTEAPVTWIEKKRKTRNVKQVKHNVSVPFD
jgi:hypothetical protein